MEEIAQNKTKDYPPSNYNPDCHIPVEDQKPYWDPRCRPWYRAAWNRPGEAILTTYLAPDETFLYVTIAKTL